jgi:phenylacetate-coenzyme A ligase PaaK-like adenylate-forming protein
MFTNEGSATRAAGVPSPFAPAPAFDAWASLLATAEVAAASWAGPAAGEALRRERLAALLRTAQRASPWYARQLAGLDAARASLAELPVADKPTLMAHFDEWVTDRELRAVELRRFVRDPSRVADAFLGRYAVWESSGSSGEPGLFVQDARALAVYDALEALRRPSPRPLARLLDPWYLGERVAFIGATHGHFAAVVSTERLRRLNPALAARTRMVSFLQPVREVNAQLDAFAPTILATYPNMALVLAHERTEGRLRAAPREVWTGGETLSPATRHAIEQAFGCPVRDSYGASEFLSLAFECPQGRLHLNSDWVILEPVDARGRTVPAGACGAGTLLTNLANHVQPLIRFPLGDRVRLPVARCACGSWLPVIEVEGRCDDSLVLRAASGELVRLTPLALTSVLEDEAGLLDYQLVQLAPQRLLLRTSEAGAAAHAALEHARAALEAFLSAHGLGAVSIGLARGHALHAVAGGKLPRVIGAPMPVLNDAPAPARASVRRPRQAARPRRKCRARAGCARPACRRRRAPARSCRAGRGRRAASPRPRSRRRRR